ncbi:hypothetical protein RO3G_15364 [Rhizopus delemar RA 99-880]|uniref:Uncharacterized protein n=1 Tax=Rhizopus delemar (strain RA 99-880 / ATCC MYA-4621 / FGSC 9543 / NRRL 43880) TaxID=246409 RepID=I1CQC3_RHIO9|nr:hypothetical protein RO3G_15364 [Rhizopus delemar RA 99-880]|eukprot:EIE90653.1 hypothetical protein RO3G_15364 [Rhizopus delemar RA 99-880]
MSLVNRPNNVLANQRYFQAPSNTLLFLRGPRDKVFVYSTAAVLGVGLVGALYGAVNMARGKK